MISATRQILDKPSMHKKRGKPGDKWKLRPAEKLYIACDGLDFTWTRAEVKRAVEIYNECEPLDAVRRIADEFGRLDEEAAILIMDLGMKGIV